jgi:DNA-binding NarL/FixJ family response regulator
MPEHTQTNRRARVIIADDNKQVREKVVQLLSPRFEVVGAATDGVAAFDMVMLLQPEIVVMDISMPGISGIEAASKIKKSRSETKTVFLSVHEDPDFVRAALAIGAHGYVVKSDMANDLNAALESALAGLSFISPRCSLSENVSSNTVAAPDENV